MINKIKREQQGAIALITVIFIALLLTIVTTSFLRITINEQRQATDDDLTKRAFFAAESGVEDAKIALNRYLNDSSYNLNGDACDPAQDLQKVLETENGNPTSEYTCQLISTISSSYEADIAAWESRSVDLRAVDPATENPTTFNSMTINWHEPTANDAFRAAGAINLPDVPNWQSGGQSFPAMLRLQISSYPQQANFGPAQVQNHVVFVNPSSGGGPNNAINFATSDGLLISQDSCDPSVAPGSGHSCEINISGPFADATRNYSIRITALYAATNIKLQLNGGSVDLEGAQATIDVTGRAGDVYRRIEAKVRLDGTDLLPDAAITSGKDVCKNFYITDLAVDNDPSDGLTGFADINSGPDPHPAADIEARPNRLCQ